METLILNDLFRIMIWFARAVVNTYDRGWLVIRLMLALVSQ